MAAYHRLGVGPERRDWLDPRVRRDPLRLSHCSALLGGGSQHQADRDGWRAARPRVGPSTDPGLCGRPASAPPSEGGLSTPGERCSRAPAGNVYNAYLAGSRKSGTPIRHRRRPDRPAPRPGRINGAPPATKASAPDELAERPKQGKRRRAMSVTTDSTSIGARARPDPEPRSRSKT